MKKISEEKRPICSCGEKMSIVEYIGYYETFSYYDCYKCEIDPSNYEPDDIIKGAYA